MHISIFNKSDTIKNTEIFKNLYPSDEQFFNAFEFHKMPSRQSAKKIRFLLAEIENHLGHALDYTQTTLEHICPYSPDEWWDKNFQEGINDSRDRLGNMVLLEKDELKRSDFPKKKIFYQDSPFQLAKKIAEYDEWNQHNLNHYQHWLAGEAVKCWQLG